MATYIKGDAVANATSYELFEKASDGTYTSLATAAEINFEVSALGLGSGDHTLVVKAHADGYDSSAYSNEVVYSVADKLTLEWKIANILNTGAVNASVTNRQVTTNMFATSEATQIVANGDFEFMPYAYSEKDVDSSIVGRLDTNGNFTGSGTGTTGQWVTTINLAEYPSEYFYRLLCRYKSNTSQTFTEVVTDCAIVS